MDDTHFMALAIKQAEIAQTHGEVPVGAVVVNAAGEVVGLGANAVIRCSDPSAHAEVVALRQAALAARNYRLPGTTLYVTLEPCAMCLGTMFHARVGRIVFGAYDPKTGACGSRLDITQTGLINHHAEIVGGVMAQACGDLLSQFFKQRRSGHIADAVIDADHVEQEPTK